MSEKVKRKRMKKKVIKEMKGECKIVRIKDYKKKVESMIEKN